MSDSAGEVAVPGRAEGEVYRPYFEMVLEMVRWGGFDGVAHLDLVKRFGARWRGVGLLTIGTDGQSPDQVDWRLAEAGNVARKAGFGEVGVFRKRAPVAVPLASVEGARPGNRGR